MIKTFLLAAFIIFGLSGCFHQEMMEPKKEVKKEVKKERPHYKAPKLNPSFYYN